MGVTVATTRVSTATATGNQDITTTDLGGLTPKAALFIVSNATADGTAANDYVLSYGAATGTANEWAVVVTADHGVATTKTYNGWSSAYSIWIPNPNDSSAIAQAEFVSFITNGVRINWTTNSLGTGKLLTVVLFAGTDLSAHANNKELGNSLGAVDITDPGFEPDIVITAISRQTVDGNIGVQGFNSRGFVHWDGVSTVTQRAYAQQLRDGRSSGEPFSYVRSDACIGQLLIAGGLDWYGVAEDFDANGFSLNVNDAGANGQDLCYLALNFNGAVGSWVGTHTTPTATGSNSETGPGFTPQSVLMLETLTEAVNTTYSDNRGGSTGIAAWDANEQYATSVSSEDAVATSNDQSLSDDVAIELPDDDGTAALTATLTSFNASGWTVNYSAVESAAKLFFGLAIEGAAAGRITHNTDSHPLGLHTAMGWRVGNP